MPGIKLLQRYQLLNRFDAYEQGVPFEVWLAKDEMQAFIVKIWPFRSDKDTQLFLRAWWETELRSLYRLSSSPNAEKYILSLREPGVDITNNCFVATLEAGFQNYQNLHLALQQRNHYPWLINRDLQQRIELWRGLLRVAQGIDLLHSQNVLHKNVSAENVFFSGDSPDTIRLSGFEWSIRIGEMHPNTLLIHPWSTPPELSKRPDMGFQPEMDWYGFGILSARCLLNIEDTKNYSPGEKNQRIISLIHSAQPTYLSDLEKTILLRLIERCPENRFRNSNDIVQAIHELLQSVEGTHLVRQRDKVLLIYNHRNAQLMDAAKEAGFSDQLEQEQAADLPSFSETGLYSRLSVFIQKQLADARLYQIYTSENEFFLIGGKLTLKIQANQPTGQDRPSWDAAFLLGPVEYIHSDGGNEIRALPTETIIVKSFYELKSDQSVYSQVESWIRFLPPQESGLQADISNLYDFIRCSNQLELLLRDAEIFEYEIVSSQPLQGQEDTITIRETKRSKQVVWHLERGRGLIQYLLEQISLYGIQNDSNRIVLCSENILLRRDEVNLESCFSIFKIDENNDEVTLSRPAPGNLIASVPERGYLHTFGMFGQIKVIRRRKEAIVRLADHQYLLRSLVEPHLMYMKLAEVPGQYAPFSEDIDARKQAIIKDILATRPIYTLQGPPGTGKTTLVAHLLLQIFAENPMAQVLITAQAHGAVDVLRQKVLQVFQASGKQELPLAVRFPRSVSKTGQGDGENRRPVNQEGSVQNQAQSILKQSIKYLTDEQNLSVLQIEWLGYAQEMEAAIDSISTADQTNEFCELVRRGANIVYCTTTASDLAELARIKQFYDWTIIEEAGKCHGFELALPLQAGHRWLLIGDQNQLPAFRIEDFEYLVTHLGDMVRNLRQLPSYAQNLLDDEWNGKWNKMEEEKQGRFIKFSQDWLKTFKRLYNHCTFAAIHGVRVITEDQPVGGAAGMLSTQYRMHPVIGNLISHAYYDGKIRNATVINETGAPNPNVIFRLAAPIIPGFSDETGIVWIDTPPAWQNPVGKEQADIPYINPLEIQIIQSFLTELKLDSKIDLLVDKDVNKQLTFAVLAPYNQQVRKLREGLKEIKMPVGMIGRGGLHTPSQGGYSKSDFVHTVDSFQGNEADLVIISLVRNNERTEPNSALGFLKRRERTNVMLSRAQRLLVLVGSWEFFWRHTTILAEEAGDDERSLIKAISFIEEQFINQNAIRVNYQHIVSSAQIGGSK